MAIRTCAKLLKKSQNIMARIVATLSFKVIYQLAIIRNTIENIVTHNWIKPKNSLYFPCFLIMLCWHFPTFPCLPSLFLKNCTLLFTLIFTASLILSDTWFIKILTYLSLSNLINLKITWYSESSVSNLVNLKIIPYSESPDTKEKKKMQN